MSMSTDNNRSYERFDKKAPADFFYNYDFTTKVDFQKIYEQEAREARKFAACTKNVSAEGLCFTSLLKLQQGERVRMEMYVGENRGPIHMEGEVRWSQAVRPGFEQEGDLYDTGVKLLTVDDQTVPETIHFDEQYHIVWSAVLESVLGKVKDLIRKKAA